MINGHCFKLLSLWQFVIQKYKTDAKHKVIVPGKCEWENLHLLCVIILHRRIGENVGGHRLMLRHLKLPVVKHCVVYFQSIMD